LEALSHRLLELLLEFAGNALLEQLLKIVRRILSFPVTSPLMKILTGLEFLHGKINDWEANASKQVSLYSHMEKIGRLIGRWRRLELQVSSSSSSSSSQPLLAHLLISIIVIVIILDS